MKNKIKEKFLKTMGDSIDIVGTFTNEYGEEYLVYRFKSKDFHYHIWVTGDELDWTTTGYRYLGGGILSHEFKLNEKEDQQLEDLLADKYRS